MKKLGLALGSSGSRGTSYIGFLKALEEHGIKPYCIAGSSMGSVVGAAYAVGMTPDEMAEEANKVKASHIVDFSLAPISNSALLRSNKLIKKLESYFDKKTVDELNIPFTCVAVDLQTGKVYNFKGKDSVAQGVAASSAIPTVFRPIKKDDMVLIDGGVKCRVPISYARDLGADVVVAVDALGPLRVQNKDYNIISVMLRAYDIMDDEICKYRHNEQLADLFLSPDLGDMMQFKFKDIDKAIETGYQLGLANIEKIKELIK